MAIQNILQAFSPPLAPPLTPPLTGVPAGVNQAGPSRKPFEFQEMMVKGFDAVNKELNQSGKISQEFLTGNKHDLHEVMIALDQADLSFRYMTQVRNKVLEAYNDMMRLQV